MVDYSGNLPFSLKKSENEPQVYYLQLIQSITF